MFSFGPRANALDPDAEDEEALRLLRTMTRVLPLRAASLATIAPDFAVEKRAGLVWEEAVAEANSRFGQSQPQRAAFLCKYLTKGSSELQLVELRLPAARFSGGDGGTMSKGFVFGPPDKPTATLSVGIAETRIVAEPRLTLATANRRRHHLQRPCFRRGRQVDLYRPCVGTQCQRFIMPPGTEHDGRRRHELLLYVDQFARRRIRADQLHTCIDDQGSMGEPSRTVTLPRGLRKWGFAQAGSLQRATSWGRNRELH